MSSTSLQFHATTDDIYKFVIELLGNSQYNACGIILSPKFKIIEFDKLCDFHAFEKFEMIFISKEQINFYENYKDFSENQDNNIGILLGYNDADTIKESSMWIKSEDVIDKDFKKCINRFKKNLIKGAWIVNPYTGDKAYYKIINILLMQKKHMKAELKYVLSLDGIYMN
ncbi:MAG: hypothetical protein E7263_00760 [Lachnospiraceae bacterium]|nr:hypothetical protein [Lachnospiraceae bacterium]